MVEMSLHGNLIKIQTNTKKVEKPNKMLIMEGSINVFWPLEPLYTSNVWWYATKQFLFFFIQIFTQTSQKRSLFITYLME